MSAKSADENLFFTKTSFRMPELNRSRVKNLACTAKSRVVILTDAVVASKVADGKKKEGGSSGPSSTRFGFLIERLLRRFVQEHIPRPTANMRMLRIIDFSAVAKLVAVFIRPLRFFVFKRDRIDT